MSGGGVRATTTSDVKSVMGTCGKCGTSFHKSNARFCRRCGVQRDLPGVTAVAAATQAATTGGSKPKEAVASQPPLFSLSKESVFSPPGAGAGETLRPMDAEQFQRKTRKGSVGHPIPTSFSEASAPAPESGGTLTSSAGASLILPDEAQQQFSRKHRRSFIYAKDSALPELPPASMADPDRFAHTFTTPSQKNDERGGAGTRTVPSALPEQKRPTTFSPAASAACAKGSGAAAAAAESGVEITDASVDAGPAFPLADTQAPSSDDGVTEEAIASLRPSAEEEAQYTTWMTLSPDDLTPEMLQTSNASELRQWHKGSLIGRGTYGSVYLGLLPDGSFHAVKCVELGNRKAATDHIGALELVSLSREINMMHRLRHPNLCTFKGVYFDSESSSICMFMEYIGGGSLATLVKKFKPLPPSVVRSWTQQLLSGLHYLHSQHIIHRDIKGDNVLVDTTTDPSSKSQIKLVDFGAARRLTDAVSQSSTVIGTPYWMAPEVVDASGDGSGYSYKADVWSVGCTVAEMLTGRPPWPSKTSAPAAIMMIASATGMPTEIPEEEATPGCLDFMRQCFIRDPKKRPAVQQLLHHPWIQGNVH
ncbi:hypothetical protein JKF63_05628 [Porcisia hertigi]|uniref:Protein kinase domain-containing protein n=1 Tax=Porcisia hertigi TaxID=2761500 RepID=A0A836I228_9TRYP|nr:hypothetical protein JKF63_05628 [Porcisia hertigi]